MHQFVVVGLTVSVPVVKGIIFSMMARLHIGDNLSRDLLFPIVSRAKYDVVRVLLRE